MIDVFTKTDREDRPLTRSDIKNLLDERGTRNETIDLHSRDLDGIDLSNLNLIRVNLIDANLANTDLTDTDLSYANLANTHINNANLTRTNLSYGILNSADLTRSTLIGANLTGATLVNTDLSHADLSYADLSHADLSHAILTETKLKNIQITKNTIFTDTSSEIHEILKNLIFDNTSTINIRILEEPLTALNFANIVSAFTHLHTKCWLIAQGRFTDLIDYTQTHNTLFTKEASLTIIKLTQNSPADIKLNVNADTSPQALVEALRIGIDAITQTPLRKEEANLKNQALKLEMHIKEQNAQHILTERAQTHEMETQRADLEKREKQLELEVKQLEIETKRLEVQEKRLDIEKKKIDYALETASKMTDILNPNADPETKEIIMRTFLTDLLQLGSSTGLTMILPTSQIKK